MDRVLALFPTQRPTAGAAFVVVTAGFLGSQKISVATQAKWSRRDFWSQNQWSFLQDLLSDFNVPGCPKMPTQNFIGGYFEALAFRSVTFLPMFLLVLPTAIDHVPAGGAQLGCLGLTQGAGCQRSGSHRKQPTPAVRRSSIDLLYISH